MQDVRSERHLNQFIDAMSKRANPSGDTTFVRPRNDPYEQWHLPPLTAANDNDPRPRAIGLMGYGGAGKSEVAKILSGYGYTSLHIKKPLRSTAAHFLVHYGLTPELIDRHLDGDLKREPIPGLGKSGTEIQQFLGTEFGRDFLYPAVWLDIWKTSAALVLRNGGKVVQESVRFENEAAAIRELGGIILRVERPGVGPLSEHVSERPPAEPDFTIHNNGTLKDLALQVATTLKHAA